MESAPAAPYYRIVSTGTVGLPGSKSLSMDSRDAVLRKLNLRTNARTATQDRGSLARSRVIAALVVRASEPIKPLVSITTTFLSIHSTQPSWVGRMVVFSQANHIPPAIRTLAWDITMLHPITSWLRIFPPIPDATVGRQCLHLRRCLHKWRDSARQSLGQEISRVNFTTITMKPMPPVYAPQWNVSSQGQIKTTTTLYGRHLC